jgi:hypothetical protein
MSLAAWINYRIFLSSCLIKTETSFRKQVHATSFSFQTTFFICKPLRTVFVEPQTRHLQFFSLCSSFKQLSLTFEDDLSQNNEQFNKKVPEKSNVQCLSLVPITLHRGEELFFACIFRNNFLHRSARDQKVSRYCLSLHVNANTWNFCLRIRENQQCYNTADKYLIILDKIIFAACLPIDMFITFPLRNKKT